MKNLLFISTGTMVGRSNGYDYRRALSEIYRLCEKNLGDGLELMMLRFYYDKTEALAEAVKSSGVPAHIIHCEKEIGTMLSNAAALYSDGKYADSETLYMSAVSLFRVNCEVGASLGIDRMVLHLWGGINSDRYIEYNISKLGELEKISEKYGIRLLIENIPSNCHDPRSNWKKLLPQLGRAGLIFDTRFGKLHEQSADILRDCELTEKIEHIHVSDFGGAYREFAALRPILHPGEGRIDFTEIFSLLLEIKYSGSVTLESPVMEEDKLNISKIEKTLFLLRENLNKI